VLLATRQCSTTSSQSPPPRSRTRVFGRVLAGMTESVEDLGRRGLGAQYRAAIEWVSQKLNICDCEFDTYGSADSVLLV
jgi:hypothetical protein